MAVAALVSQTPVVMATIGQVSTRVTALDTTHDVDRGIGQCTIRTPALFSWVVLGASVSIQIGYEDTGTQPVFIGTVVNVRRSLSENGGWELVASCEGQLARMVDGEETTVQFPKIYLGDIARSLTSMRGVGPLMLDRIKSPVLWDQDTNWIILGGNRYVDDGMVVINNRSGLYGWLSQKLELFGYRIFDRPAADVKVARLFGSPTHPQHFATEGVDIFRADRGTTNDQINYWEVTGSSYTDDDGIPIKFRSIPASIPFDNRLRPKGFRTGTVSDGVLSSQFLADTVRQVHEINYTEPTDTTSWEMPGNPLVQPGDVIQITSEIMGHTNKSLWITGVRHQLSDQGFWTTIDAWSGNGAFLATGNDEVTVNVVTNPVHVGDETIPWYASPSPSGTHVSFEITVPDDYTAIVLEWYSHGCNSYFLDGASSESTVSKIVVEQGGEEVGSAELPMQPEEYELQRPYGSGLTYWGFNRRPVPGRLKAGRATVRITSGEDKRLPESTKWDDFEVRDVVLKLTGVGTPVLPTPRG